MSTAHDLFAETNPAFGTFALLGFCRSYLEAAGKDPHVALAYVALPIAMSDDLDKSFMETSARTGLLSWLNRYPDIRLELGKRLELSRDVVTSAVRLGLASRALRLGVEGTIGPDAAAPTRRPVEKLPSNPKQVIKRAERLGTWMGHSGSTGAVFSAFGVMP
ncbi:UNVERIFIED_ORG: hypothetical protein GGI61_000986 [Rhizobium esperanzae]